MTGGRWQDCAEVIVAALQSLNRIQNDSYSIHFATLGGKCEWWEGVEKEF